MATKFLKLAVGAAILAGASSAYAAGITGDISFGASFTPADGSFQEVSIASATSIDYNDNGTQDSASAIVTGVTGDFAADGITAFSTIGTVYDFVFSPLAALGSNVWSVAGTTDTYTFTLTSVSISAQNGTTLSLVGSGYVSGSDFDQTAGLWNFTGNPNGNSGTFSFSSGASVTPVPEPEIYAMMAAGLGLMGFVARRRQRNGAVA